MWTEMWGERFIGPFTIRRKLLRRRHAMKERRKRCNAKNNPQKSILQQALEKLASSCESESRESRRPDMSAIMNKRKQEATSSFQMVNRGLDFVPNNHAPRCYNIPTFITISPLKCRPRNMYRWYLNAAKETIEKRYHVRPKKEIGTITANK